MKFKVGDRVLYHDSDPELDCDYSGEGEVETIVFDGLDYVAGRARPSYLVRFASGECMSVWEEDLELLPHNW